MGKESSSIILEKFMKGKLLKISKVVKVLRSIPMAQGIRVNLSVD